MEQIPNQDTINEQRGRFLERAKMLAEKYEVQPEDVVRIFAESEGTQVEKYQDDTAMLEKLFTEEEFRDEARWEMVETKLQLYRSEENAMTDALTGLYNRGALDHELKRRAEMFERDLTTDTPKPFSYIIIDLDEFKQVNDSFGHQVGDEVLKTISRKIKEHIRAADFLARYGGEEISILVAGDIETAKIMAERIREDIANLDKPSLQALGIDTIEREALTASFGISEYTHTGDINNDIKMMKESADQALYLAKASGRNQVQVARPNTSGK